MSDVMIIHTMDELRKFLNEKGVLEITLRNKNKQFKTFQKIALDKLEQNEVLEKVKQAIALLNKNNDLNEKALNMLDDISKLSGLSLVLSGLNLCIICAGFTIMFKKLDKMSAQIEAVVAVYKEGKAIHANHEFNKILSEHSNMLDCRKKQNYYTEDQMRKLVADEYNVLDLLIKIFLKGISRNRDELLFSILSLAQMLSASIRYFDETYYFKNKEAIGDGDRWHMDHDTWVSVFDTLSSPKFIETIQDFGIFEIGLNTVENDCFYINFYDQMRSLKQDVEDNQFMIEAIDDPELYRIVIDKSTEEVKHEIEAALGEAGVPLETCEKIVSVAVA